MTDLTKLTERQLHEALYDAEKDHGRRIAEIDAECRRRSELADSERGLYKKFEVRRIRATEKHMNCEYFVLDLNHDKFAMSALTAYAAACKEEYPQLAQELLIKIHKSIEKECSDGGT